jgi:hypothetical protein
MPSSWHPDWGNAVRFLNFAEWAKQEGQAELGKFGKFMELLRSNVEYVTLLRGHGKGLEVPRPRSWGGRCGFHP